MQTVISFSLPFMSLPDPVVSGEGVLDPLGLARAGDALADWLVPAMTARMGRPRFLTGMAIGAAVCQGLEDRIAEDGVSPAYLVFEWLMIGGFARAAAREDVVGTPGIEKARTALAKGIPLSSATYLKTPSVFGFHGVYRRLAVASGVVDDDLRLAENGYRLIKAWEREQGLEGFSDAFHLTAGLRGTLRSAVEAGLADGFISRSDAWQGWGVFARHLVPAKPGRNEAAFLQELVLDPKGETRGELFKLLARRRKAAEEGEASIARSLLAKASEDLAQKLNTILAFEEFCAAIECAFDLLRHLSTRNGAHALTQATYAQDPDIASLAKTVPARLRTVEQMIEAAPTKAVNAFAEIAKYFADVQSASDLYRALLERHAQVQQAKPPEGKREWFEHGQDDAVFVRIPYRLDERPGLNSGWNRPYRIYSLQSFCNDLGARS